MDYTIDEIQTLQTANEQKTLEIQRIDNQLNKALEVNKLLIFIYYSRYFLDC